MMIRVRKSVINSVRIYILSIYTYIYIVAIHGCEAMIPVIFEPLGLPLKTNMKALRIDQADGTSWGQYVSVVGAQPGMGCWQPENAPERRLCSNLTFPRPVQARS